MMAMLVIHQVTNPDDARDEKRVRMMEKWA